MFKTQEDASVKHPSARRAARGASLAAVGVAAGSAVALAFGGTAQAIPVPASAYHYFGAYSLQQSQGRVALPGTSVVVANGKVARRVIVQVSLDAGIPKNSELRLSYLVDGVFTAEYKYGPANIANHVDFWQTRTADALIPLPAGSHRIQIVLRVSSSSPTATASVQDALITAESQTR
jgi:hypothetical protein